MQQSKAGIFAKDLDIKNLKKIQAAFDGGEIDAVARDYLSSLYTDSMECFQHTFYFLGRTLGAPKTPIYRYDSATNSAADKELAIADLNPSGTYVVHHRFDGDPMRNQFFTFGGTDVRLFVSSIVSVIVAAQKSVGRAIDKITGKYYDDYVTEVLAAVERVLVRHKRSASVKAIQDKITDVFRSRFISAAAPAVLKIIGNIFPEISVDLVRELDKIKPPHVRLKDVYRMKLLFDTVPQINAFVKYVQTSLPAVTIASVRNKFYDLDNAGGYRDAKMVVIFEHGGHTIPMEIIMNVRTFFNAELASHTTYETARQGTRVASSNRARTALHHGGIVEYNAMICQAVAYLMHRVGWNIVYDREWHAGSFFNGFPEVATLPYDHRIVDAILKKMDNSVDNEIFRLPYSPRPLSRYEEIELFRYITRFILFAALPYSFKYEEVKNMGFSGKVFNFVMKELYRYYENDVL